MTEPIQQFQKAFSENKYDALEHVFSSLFNNTSALSETYTEEEKEWLASFISSQISLLSLPEEIRVALDCLLFLEKEVPADAQKYFAHLLSHENKNIRMKLYRLISQKLLPVPESTILQQLKAEKEIDALFSLLQIVQKHSIQNAHPVLQELQKKFGKKLEGSATKILLENILNN